MSLNTRQKGQELENHVCDEIKAKGIDDKARPSHGSGSTNREKADIWTSMMVLGQNVGIECKNQKTLAIPDWWKQTKKLESLGREPVLAFKIHGENLSESKVIIYLDTFLELVKNQKGRIERETNTTKKIEFDRAIEKVIEAGEFFKKN